jgi:phosphatidate cytidylyltransferase
MAGPDDRGGEDLFEDLDQYFAPIDEVDWPADDPSRAVAADPEIVLPGAPEEDVVIDLREPTPEPAAAVSPGMGASGPAAGAPDMGPRASAGGPPADEPAAPRSEPTAEMSGEDWRRLRDVLGDDDDDIPAAPEPEPYEPPPSVAVEPPPAVESEEERAAWGPPGADARELEEAFPDVPAPATVSAEDEERRDLTLDDLKKAPPEYEALPGPAAPAEAAPISAEEAAEVFIAAPEPADVEQAAERFAESIRVETGEHPPVAADVEPEGLVAPVGGSAGELQWEDEDDVVPSAGSGLGLGPDPLGDDALGGPAWEESAPDAVGAEHTGGPGTGERNLPAATITALVLVAAALISIAISTAAFATVAGLIVLLAQAELYATMQRRGYRPATALGLVVGAMLLAAAYLKGEQAMLLFVVMGTMLAFLWYMVEPAKAREGAVRNIGVTILGIVYVPFLAGYALVLLSAPSGRALVLSILGLTFLYDISAFAVGSFYGHRPLAPSISPKKSWEGLLGATIVTVAVGLALLPSIAPIDPSFARAAGMAVIIVIFAPLGDLAESLIKRDLHVKDMGTLLPGHGGVLDRIDSALFVVPAALYFLRLVLG